MNEIEKKIIEIINKIRPYLNQDGGDVEFVSFKDGICYVRLKGACAGCFFSDITIENTVEEMIVSEIPEVVKVKQIQEL